MARFASQSKMGYYKTPPHLVPLIAEYLHAPEPSKTMILDPCAGTGEALLLLGRALGVTRLFANELDESRAEECRANGLTTACGDGVFELKTPERSFSLILLNPPYDQESGEGRTEMKFLHTLRFLRKDGILVYIVPLEVLKRKEFSEKLPVLLKDIIVCRFPDQDFKAFGQAVLFGRKCTGKLQEETARYHHYINNPLVIGDGQRPSGSYTVPPAIASSPFYFYSQNLDPHTVRHLLRHPQAKKALEHGIAQDVSRTVSTLMPLRSGHQAVILATGIMDGVYRAENGNLWIVAGATGIAEHVTTEHDEDKTVTRTRFTPTPTVNAVDLTATLAAGEFVVHNLT